MYYNLRLLKKFLILLLFLSFSIISFAQNNFQKGSYIDQAGKKNEGYIYNLDWQFNPTEIEFKNILDGESKLITVDNIQEFEIDGYCKYIKYEGLIDDSSAKLDELGFNRNPIWKPVTILVKVLVDSDASLFFYNTKDYSRFFYNIKSKDLKIQQLVSKEFYLNGNKSEIGKNFQFRQQLANDMNCSSNESSLSKLIYNKKDLVKFFLDFNKCQGIVVDSSVNRLRSNNKIKFNYSLLIGFSSLSFGTTGNNSYNEYQFDNIYSYPIGGEVELVLPINNNKWSLYFQPSYQSFSADETIKGKYIPIVYEINYKSLHLPIGLRHYFFLNDKKSKIYLNGSVGFNKDIGSEIVLENNSNFSFFSSALGFNLGAAYVLNNRFSFEFKYSYSTNLINDSSFKSDFDSLGLLFKYQLNK